MYPPLTTDFDRQVRAKTHAAHTSLCVAAGKRFSKYLKSCIGPWITSLQDIDRQVSKAATESFNTVFDTDKKKEIIWKKYSEDVINYISDILTNETAKTISTCPRFGGVLMTGDERFMSSEDMDTRFALVLGGCLATLALLAGIL